MFNHLPDVTNQTPEERISALHEAKNLVTAIPGNGGITEVFSGRKAMPAPDVDSMIRVAEYINTGHDYRDTHDEREEPDYQRGMLIMPDIFFPTLKVSYENEESEEKDGPEDPDGEAPVETENKEEDDKKESGE